MRKRREEPEASEAEDAPRPRAHHVVHEYPDPELGRFHRRHHPYSIWSGMKYVLVLSLLLWWLPTIGQMIAGYIGGRRAGGPWRGVVAAIAPVFVIVLFAWGLEHGLVGPFLTGVAAIPTAIANGVAAVVPPLAPYANFVVQYLGTFVEAMKSTLSMGQNGYLVTVVFAYIGGILAEQTRREAATGRGTAVGIHITQPLLAPFRRPFEDWQDDHPERFEALRKIPVRSAPAGEAPARPKTVPKPHKVEGKAPVSGAEEGGRPAAGPKPERREPNAHDKEVATRRFVERALRQYEAAHRR